MSDNGHRSIWSPLRRTVDELADFGRLVESQARQVVSTMRAGAELTGAIWSVLRHPPAAPTPPSPLAAPTAVEPTPAAPTAVEPKPEPISVEAISQRAFEIYERNGRQPGRDDQNWIDAEAELRAEAHW